MYFRRNFRCKFCGSIFDTIEVVDNFVCPNCGKEPIRKDIDFSKTNLLVKVFPEEGLHLKNVSSTGKTFHSKKEMVKFANRNNMELGAL